MSMKVRIQLCVMVFLEFFIWGGWLVTTSNYLGTIGFSGSDIGTAYSMNNIAAIVSPFFVGMIADKFFSAQKVLAVMHLLSAVFLYLAANTTNVISFTIYILAHSLCYMPTLALINSISFHQMSNPGKQFPYIRVFGTIGWIVAGLVISYVLPTNGVVAEKTNQPLLMAAIASLVLGLYAFTLPNTPPDKSKQTSFGDILGVKAWSLLKDKSFFIFSLGSLLICIPLAFYYNFTNAYLSDVGMDKAAAIQSLGQVSETLFMILMPFFFVRLGVKKMIALGMLAWVLRYICFSFGASSEIAWIVITGLVLHGICYDFFFVTGQIYVDKVAPQDIKSCAQGFITLLTYGVGMTIGSLVSGRLVDMCTTADGIRDWTQIWIIPGCIALVVLILFYMLFKDVKTEESK